MRTRPGQKRALPEQGDHRPEAPDEQLLQRQLSIADAIRKLTSGPSAEGRTGAPDDRESSYTPAHPPGGQALRNGIKREK